MLRSCFINYMRTSDVRYTLGIAQVGFKSGSVERSGLNRRKQHDQQNFWRPSKSERATALLAIVYSSISNPIAIVYSLFQSRFKFSNKLCFRESSAIHCLQLVRCALFSHTPRTELKVYKATLKKKFQMQATND